MARALAQIMSELSSVYQPQKDLYNTQLTGLDPTMQAEQKGLEAQKQDSFNQITQGANRRGLLFSGIPLEEQARYTGSSFLPAVANLKSKYAQQRFNLQDALSKINQDQYTNAYGMYNDELALDEAAKTRAAAAPATGWTPTNAATEVLGDSTGTLRQRWQEEASAGDWNSQVALNYAGDDGRYDGVVNSRAEYDILKSMGITGNYYVAGGGNTRTGNINVGVAQNVPRISGVR